MFLFHAPQSLPNGYINPSYPFLLLLTVIREAAYLPFILEVSEVSKLIGQQSDYTSSRHICTYERTPEKTVLRSQEALWHEDEKTIGIS